MVAMFVLVFGAIVAAAGRLGFKPGPGLRALRLAIKLRRHRTALAAMCPAPTGIPAPLAATFPIHLNAWGASGPTVLLVHGGVQGGLGGGPATFGEQKALAERGWRLLTPDRPGFGQSPSRGPDDMLADSVWLSDHLGDGAHVISHSFGGAVALLAAARRPSAVRSLILIEPALAPLLPGSKAFRTNPAVSADFLRMVEGWLSARTPADYGLALARDLGVVSRRNSGASEPDGALDPQAAHALGCAFLRMRPASARALRRAALAVARARIPVLVVTGGWSPTFEAVGAIGAELTGGRHVVVRSPNHFVQLAAPDAFNRLADEFMRAAEVKRRSA